MDLELFKVFKGVFVGFIIYIAAKKQNMDVIFCIESWKTGKWHINSIFYGTITNYDVSVTVRSTDRLPAFFFLLPI